MVFKHRFIFLILGLTFGLVTAIVLDAFLGSFVIASFGKVDSAAQNRAAYLENLKELGGSGIITVSSKERLLLERQNNIWVMVAICLASALLSAALIGLIIIFVFHITESRLAIQSVFWLNLLVVSGLYKLFPLSETPLGISVASLLAKLWLGLWGK